MKRLGLQWNRVDKNTSRKRQVLTVMRKKNKKINTFVSTRLFNFLKADRRGHYYTRMKRFHSNGIVGILSN